MENLVTLLLLRSSSIHSLFLAENSVQIFLRSVAARGGGEAVWFPNNHAVSPNEVVSDGQGKGEK